MVEVKKITKSTMRFCKHYMHKGVWGASLVFELDTLPALIKRCIVKLVEICNAGSTVLLGTLYNCVRKSIIHFAS